MTDREVANARAWLADSLGLEFAEESLAGPAAAVRDVRRILERAAAALPFEAEPSATERLRADFAPETLGDA